MVKIGALWKQIKEDGMVYLKGRIDFPGQIIINEETDILLFRNKSKHKKAPYFDLLIAKSRRKETKATKSESDFDDESFDSPKDEEEATF